MTNDSEARKKLDCTRDDEDSNPFDPSPNKENPTSLSQLGIHEKTTTTSPQQTIQAPLRQATTNRVGNSSITITPVLKKASKVTYSIFNTQKSHVSRSAEKKSTTPLSLSHSSARMSPSSPSTPTNNIEEVVPSSQE